MKHTASAVAWSGLSAPAHRLACWGLGLFPVLLWLAWQVFAAGLPVTSLVYLAGLAFVVLRMAQHYPHRAVGACNIVTTVRFMLVAVLCAGIGASVPLAPEVSWAVFGIAAVALSLDGVDGWLARRQALVSAFGARFDMEVDALLAAVLALLLFMDGRAGPELLVLGGARYVFVLASYVWPWLDTPLPASFRRKLVCVIQIAALAALALPVLPYAAGRVIALTASVLLVWSFAVDIRWLARRRCT
ncbi:Phosphatidylglycerophosphate synthase [Loktanella sp. DSM 29012]|uniref:CDP-alcohol phosphatidyltransferase family protein n=1 Tax=Loktanella sp. DSM 29012 TaxID=1881056 RepID=UPI0008ABD754|nr:CDP-alcohol phosphatidyltransferase family protein [Loktanella sp. DSM 29012]SEQ79925.1 Phosphatidylglycerophosphate synthase [Loktanella sp. DSM 29012]